MQCTLVETNPGIARINHIQHKTKKTKKTMKKLTLLLTFILSAASFATDRYVPFDPYNLINTEMVEKYHIEDDNQLIDFAVNKFDWMNKNNMVNSKLCKLYAIRDHVDFIHYILGYYERDYAQMYPNSEKAQLQLEADRKFESCWRFILSAAKNNFSNSQEIIAEEWQTMSSFDVVYFCSPELRRTMAEKRNFVFSLKSWLKERQKSYK